MSEIEIKIAADDGVHPVKSRAAGKRNKPRSPRMQAYIDAFAGFRPGQSFFVEGLNSKEVEFLRQPFTDAGLGVLIRNVECDEIYGVAGVRVWRQPGEYDSPAPATAGTKIQTVSASPKAPTTPAAPVAADYDPDLDGPVTNEEDEL